MIQAGTRVPLVTDESSIFYLWAYQRSFQKSENYTGPLQTPFDVVRPFRMKLATKGSAFASNGRKRQISAG